MNALLTLTGGLLLGGGCIAVAIGSIVMQVQVNEELPVQERYSYLVQWPGKSLIIMSLHRQFFPESTLRKFLGRSLLSLIAGIGLLGLTGHL